MTSYSTSEALSDQQVKKVNDLINLVSERQLKDFGNISTDIKADGTLITDCDRWSDSVIVDSLKEISNQEGVLSEEGSKVIPSSASYWVVDPLDGTTNFSAGIPYWAISIARFTNGTPETVFLDIPPLNKRVFALRGKGVWINGKKITADNRNYSHSSCVSLCSRSIRILQKQPNTQFPGKIRLLGVSSLNMISVGLGQTIAALEATPKIWDLAAAWLILSELNCPIKWLELKPSNIGSGRDLSNINFPLLAANSIKTLEKFEPWGEILINR